MAEIRTFKACSLASRSEREKLSLAKFKKKIFAQILFIAYYMQHIYMYI
jgi:hypothetical protein